MLSETHLRLKNTPSPYSAFRRGVPNCATSRPGSVEKTQEASYLHLKNRAIEKTLEGDGRVSVKLERIALISQPLAEKI